MLARRRRWRVRLGLASTAVWMTAPVTAKTIGTRWGSPDSRTVASRATRQAANRSAGLPAPNSMRPMLGRAEPAGAAGRVKCTAQGTKGESPMVLVVVVVIAALSAGYVAG